MAINLDGSTQYVRVGSAGTALDVYRTRPFTVAAHFDSTYLDDGAVNALFQIGSYAAGWGLRVYLTHLQMLYSGSGVSPFSGGISAGTGWWTVAVSARDMAGWTQCEFYQYRHNTSTLTKASANTTDSDPTAPGAGAETCIGAWDDFGTQYNHFEGALGWVGVWAGDFSDASSANPPRIHELIVRGPWGLIDSDCKLFVPMLRSSLLDHSPNRYSIANVNGAGFVGGGPTELPLSGVMFPIVTDGVAATTLSAGANTATVTNPTTSFSLALALSGGANTITATAPTTGFTLGGLTLAGGANTITATAPTSTLAAVLALSGGTQFITATAPTGTFNLGGLTLAAGAVVSTVSNATASLDSGLFFNAGTQTVTVTCPAGTFVLGGLSLAAGAQTATVTNANAVVAAALGLQQSGQSLLMVAPSVNMVVGSLTLTAGGLEITVVAPSALVSAGGVITTSTGLAIRLVPADRFDQGPVKGYYIA